MSRMQIQKDLITSRPHKVRRTLLTELQRHDGVLVLLVEEDLQQLQRHLRAYLQDASAQFKRPYNSYDVPQARACFRRLKWLRTGR